MSFRLTHILSLPGNFHPSRSAISAQRCRRGRRGWWWLAKRRAGSGWATFAPGQEWTSLRARAAKTWAASLPLQPPLPPEGRNLLGRNLRGRSKGPGKKMFIIEKVYTLYTLHQKENRKLLAQKQLIKWNDGEIDSRYLRCAPNICWN